jgi:hypothetical protein
VAVTVFSARVLGRKVVPNEGETTPALESELLDAIGEVERGETVRAQALFERLRR